MEIQNEEINQPKADIASVLIEAAATFSHPAIQSVIDAADEEDRQNEQRMKNEEKERVAAYMFKQKMDAIKKEKKKKAAARKRAAKNAAPAPEFVSPGGQKK